MTEKTLHERNLEMWERFVNHNMDLMFKSMEKAMEGATVAQEQMEKAVDKGLEGSGVAQERMAEAVDKTIEGTKTFQDQVTRAVAAGMAVQLDATMAVLQSLERQVEKLSVKVDELLESQQAEATEATEE